MAEDDKTGEGAADLTGETAGAAGQQQTGEEQAAAGQTQENMVPVAALEDERAKRQQVEQQLASQQQYYNHAIQLTQANQPQGAQPPQQKGFAGLSEDEIAEAQVNPQKFVEVLNKFGQTVIQGVQQQNFTSQHQDFAEIVGSVNPHTGMFEPAEPLQKVLQENPSLSFALQNNPYGGQIAYSLAMKEKALMEQAEKIRASQEHAAQQQANTVTTPMSTAAAGAGGAIQQAAQFAGDPRNWTDEQRAEFDRVDREVMAGKHEK